MSSCLGRRHKHKVGDEETQPLVAQYEDETVLQRRLHQKLHTYQMLRALGGGFMPSNDQLIVNLRTLLASDVLNPDTSGLTDSGRQLAKYSKQFVQQFIEALLHKNGQDQIQDLIWCLTKSRLTIDTTDISRRAAKAKAKADTVAAYQSLRTVGSLLLTNSDFRVFLSDLQSVGREVFKDSAFAVSKAAEDTGKKLDAVEEPTKTDFASSTASDPSLSKPGQSEDTSDAHKDAPTRSDLESDVQQVSKIVGQEVTQVAQETQQSLKEHLSGNERQVLISRLKKVVVNLRQKPNYEDSVSTLSVVLQRYAIAYSRAAEQVVEAAEQDIESNRELDLAVQNFGSLVRTFGEPEEWDRLQKDFQDLISHQQRNAEFEAFVNHLGKAIQDIMTNPSSLDHTEEKFQQLRNYANSSETGTSLRSDIDKLMIQLRRTLSTAILDEDIKKLTNTSLQIFSILSPINSTTSSELLQDAVNVFVPQLISAIQYVPIPRVEVSTPDIDLLLENLILEPGETVNRSSFLPYRLKVETRNDIEIRKTYTLSTVSRTKTYVTLKIEGLSLRADEIGYWFRLHSGPLLRMQDRGIASFAVDSRGVDIAIDIAINPPSSTVDSILTLRSVRVTIHKLSYQLRKSRFAWLAFLLKPILRPILRKALETQLATAIGDFFKQANLELLFARERLRATRIADPEELLTFFRAVLARLTPEADPDVYSRVGVAPVGPGSQLDSRANIFRGVYAPGSVVKIWEEEARQAKERVEDWKRDGWRNDIFDVNTVT